MHYALEQAETLISHARAKQVLNSLAWNPLCNKVMHNFAWAPLYHESSKDTTAFQYMYGRRNNCQSNTKWNTSPVHEDILDHFRNK